MANVTLVFTITFSLLPFTFSLLKDYVADITFPLK